MGADDRDREHGQVDGVTHLMAPGSTATNLRLAEDAVKMVRTHGGEPAAVAEVRQALANG